MEALYILLVALLIVVLICNLRLSRYLKKSRLKLLRAYAKENWYRDRLNESYGRENRDLDQLEALYDRENRLLNQLEALLDIANWYRDKNSEMEIDIEKLTLERDLGRKLSSREIHETMKIVSASPGVSVAYAYDIVWRSTMGFRRSASDTKR